ncbi:MAG: HAMP domain-containing protein, partial [Caulobacteraceae bacterium]|nr:HAMP domain-containing protein [Caulobacter sp.]
MRARPGGGGRLSPQTFVAFAALLVLLASAVALVMVYGVGQRIITEGERRQAYAERDLLEEVALEEGADSAASAVARRARFSTGGERYGLFDRAGHAIAGDIAHFEPGFRSADWRMVRLDGGGGKRLHVVSADLPDGGMIVVGRDLSGVRRFERAILYGFAAALAIVAGAGFAAGLVLNLLILRRVDAIALTAERIAAGDLSARTPLSDRRDPFGRVGASLNAMLARLEELMTGMRTVTDSLAHDLRSPLTRMEGALARALHAGATEDERLDA